MDAILAKLDPIVAVLVAGNALQYVMNRKDIGKLTEVVSGLTVSVVKLTERLGGGGK
jgi:hypothetical protein